MNNDIDIDIEINNAEPSDSNQLAISTDSQQANNTSNTNTIT